LSHSYWENQLGADPSVLGQSIGINGQTMTIVGVAPRGFEGTTLGTQPRVFVPISMAGKMWNALDQFEERKAYWLYAFGRTLPGVPLAAAAERLNAVYRPIINDIEAPLQENLSAERMAQFRAKQLVLEPGARGQTDLQGEAKTPLLILFSVTGVVLLIACTNVANLLLARVTTRSGEMAVRVSLGASRGRLIGQLLTESALLAVLAGAASLTVALGTLRLVTGFLPPDTMVGFEPRLDGPVLLFVAALSLATTAVFGLLPAVQSTRVDLMSVMNSGSRKFSAGRGAAAFRSGLVTGQIALSMALLCSAGLFVRSLMNVSRVELGIRPDSLVTFTLAPMLNGYSNAQSRVLFRRVEEELAALPGVETVSSSIVRLVSGSNWGNNVRVEGFEITEDTDANARFNMVGPGYFRTVGMPLLVGREFTPADDAGRPAVAVVNEAFARKFELGANPVGKRMSMGSEALDIEIVGLAKDAAYSEVKGKVPPVFFIPTRQDTTLGFMSYYVRTAAEPAAVLRAIAPAIAKLDANLPVSELKTVPQEIKENVFLDRMLSSFSAAFAMLATLLAAVGLYGVLAYTVAQRTREIGVRMALGADAGTVRGLVLRQVGSMTATGTAIGLMVAVGIGRLARSMLFGLSGADPISYLGAAVFLAAVALFAGYLPARRAARVHPMQALRYE